MIKRLERRKVGTFGEVDQREDLDLKSQLAWVAGLGRLKGAWF